MNQANLNIQIIEIQKKHDWHTLCKILEENFKINPGDINRLHILPDVIETFGDLLATFRRLLEDSNNISSVLKPFYKALRNAVVCNTDIQVFVSHKPSILKDTQYVLRILRQSSQDDDIACLKMLLQFLINLTVNNTLVNRQLWSLFKEDLKDLIKNNICLYHTSALVYNIFNNDITLLEEDTEIIEYVLDSYKQNNNNEYLTFLLELFVKNVNLNKLYILYKAEHRMLCLEMMKELLSNDKTLITEELMQVLSEQFKKKSDCILKTVTYYLKDIEPFEVTLLLELLAAISSDEIYAKHMQNDKSLLINCAFLLQSIHSLGKETDNNFSVIPKLAQVTESDVDIFQHPSYGFKASLIRLLANLCWKHRENQDELRALDCIPLLLDCCNMDARNPFIIQWVVFAIRNLLDDNTQNQAVVAAMKKEGVVSSAALHEMGITLHNDEDNTIKIVPLDFNK